MTQDKATLTLTGKLLHVKFSASSGYGVFEMQASDGAEVTVVGFAPDPAPGEHVEAVGNWMTHSRYGMQFKADHIERTLPASAAAMIEYLSSRVVTGIGPATAVRLVSHFGDQTLSVMAEKPERLSEVAGISAKRAALIGEQFAKQNAVRGLMTFLCAHQLPPHLAVPLSEAYGSDAIEALKEDPYLLIDKAFSVDFSLADKLADALDFDGEDPHRVQAAVTYELTINADEGHVYLPEDKLVAAVVQLIQVGEPAVNLAIEHLVEMSALVREEGGHKPVCYLRTLYEAECIVAERLMSMTKKLPPPRRLERLLLETERDVGIDYAPAQREALHLAAQRQTMLLTGGPGTGKTTTLRAMLALFDRLQFTCLLAAPTGRAAKRMQELTGRDAQTIHRLLEVVFDPVSGHQGFAHDRGNPLQADVVVVDEVSMVDIQLMRALMEALPAQARLILVGDPDQLPSVGPGNVLSDIIGSGRVDAVHLTEVFRQASESQIVMRAHEINRGAVSSLRNSEGDFYFLSRWEPQMALETILELCARRLPDHMGFSPSSIQVLSPTRKGVCGTVNLNRQLQSVLNPPGPSKAEVSFGEYVFRQGDRVMQVKNNYDLLWRSRIRQENGMGVFNGDIGFIESVDPQAEQLIVDFDDRFATYTFDMLGELEPAYAMTVHKAQGSEYSAVVLAALPGPPMLMNRKVLYTAVTRAKSLLVLVGQENTVRGMAESYRAYRRYSGLKKRLRAHQEADFDH